MQKEPKCEDLTAWELFELITSAHGGKQMYFFEQEDVIYSRWSCKYMTFSAAINEFMQMIRDEHYVQRATM